MTSSSPSVLLLLGLVFSFFFQFTNPNVGNFFFFFKSWVLYKSFLQNKIEDIHIFAGGKKITDTTSKQSIKTHNCQIKHLQNSISDIYATAQQINATLWSAGGRCDEPQGSEHLSRCVIPLDKSFHHHLRRALRGAERGAPLLRPQSHSTKWETEEWAWRNIDKLLLIAAQFW